MEGRGLQIAGFTISLVSMFIFGGYGLTGITGLILAAVGRSQAARVGGRTGFGTAGIVLGIISAIGSFIFGMQWLNMIM